MAPRGRCPDEADARTLEERYGLEPVFEPGDEGESAGDPGGGGTEPYTIECPYCGECFETLLDLSAGSASYIEDCRVCCQPIEFDVRTDAGGRLSKVSVGRGD
jgi:Cysteine-rich CPXCG